MDGEEAEEAAPGLSSQGLAQLLEDAEGLELSWLAEAEELSSEEALRRAEAEGLELVPSSNSAGYRGVGTRTGRRKPYEAHVWRGGTGGKLVHLGMFVTPEEAALCYARTPEARVAAGRASGSTRCISR